MQGIFQKKEPKDLYAKLCGDLERLRNDNRDENAAMDFFITAESLTDWMFPGSANSNIQKRFRNGSVLLQIVSHLASGAKHMKVEAKHHASVNNTFKQGGYFGSRHFASPYFPAAYFPKGNLIIELSGKAAILYGKEISAISLAEKVTKFFEGELQ